MNATLRLLGSVVAATANGYCSCVATTGPGVSYATIQGVVVRGPTVVACFGAAACSAVPFSVGFTVRQGDQQVARFRSGADGAFTVNVPVGNVTIVPDNDAPIASPATQRKNLEVPSTGRSGVVLAFDTGIR